MSLTTKRGLNQILVHEMGQNNPKLTLATHTKKH